MGVKVTVKPPPKIPTILIVEDEPDLLEVMVDVLEQRFKVVTCDSVAGSIVKLQNQVFDCIVLDIGLPKKSGEELINLLEHRSYALNAKTPIVVCSGRLDEELIRRVGPRVQTVVVKPFSTEDLLARVTGAIKARQSQIPPGKGKAAA